MIAQFVVILLSLISIQYNLWTLPVKKVLYLHDPWLVKYVYVLKFDNSKKNSNLRVHVSVPGGALVSRGGNSCVSAHLPYAIINHRLLEQLI